MRRFATGARFDASSLAEDPTLLVTTTRKQVNDGRARVDSSDPKLLEVSVPRLPKGTYHVVWKVVARDGHRTSGDYEFTVK